MISVVEKCGQDRKKVFEVYIIWCYSLHDVALNTGFIIFCVCSLLSSTCLLL